MGKLGFERPAGQGWLSSEEEFWQLEKKRPSCMITTVKEAWHFEYIWAVTGTRDRSQDLLVLEVCSSGKSGGSVTFQVAKGGVDASRS